MLSCDFIVLSDKILKFRKQAAGTKERKIGRKKLAGSPFDVFLTAIWNTLKDFYNDKKFNSNIRIEQISLKTDRFKHDIESIGDTGNDSTEDITAWHGNI